MKSCISTGELGAERRPDYNQEGQSTIDILPFVGLGACRTGNLWKVEPADYETACAKGREYAAHFALYLKTSHMPGINLLGHIAAATDFADPETKGYWVGFYSFLERLIFQFSQNNDAWSYFERLNEEYAAINAARTQEGEA